MRGLLFRRGLILVVLITILSIGGWSCGGDSQSKDSRAPKMSIRIVFPDAHPATAAPDPGDKAGTLPDAALIPYPGDTVYHIKITITNPEQIEYVFGYVPGAPVTLLLASGVKRVIYVEGWEVSSVAQAGVFPGRHFITTTPKDDRTVNLLGEPVDLVITVGLDPATGSVSTTLPYVVSQGGSSVPLPAAADCPRPDQYWATVTDLDWPIVFPSMPVTLYSGITPQTVSFSGLAQGGNYAITVWHESAGITAATSFYQAGPAASVGLAFTGYTSPNLTMTPDRALTGLIPGTYVNLNVALAAGFGGMSGLLVGAADTCMGSITGNVYKFMVPYGKSSCVAAVSAQDCGGTAAPGSVVAGINATPPPACMDGVDNDLDGRVDYPLDPGCLSMFDPCELGTLACDDGVNNDSDGLVDMLDPGCASPLDASELNPAVECDDGADNPSDLDTLADMNDPGCTGPTDPSELGTAACDDGIDNDGWGDVDGTDPGCASPADTSEYGANACDDGVDNDAASGWGDPDWLDPACLIPTGTTEYLGTACDDGVDNDAVTGWNEIDGHDPACLSPFGTSELWGGECDDGADNDGWGDVDAADPGCAGSSDISEYSGLECDDGLDNDGWGDVDFNDPACASPAVASELLGTECDDGLDNDGWMDIDSADPGCLSPQDISEYGFGRLCDDGADNDGDGLIDHDDPECVSSSGAFERSAWFVAGDGDNSTGRSWPGAYTGIQTAISAASAGDVVFVKEGVYPGVGGPPYNGFINMRDNIQVYGGFQGFETQLSQRAHPWDHPTIIDGQYAADHVVVGASFTRLDGFFITRGQGNADEGGGMYILSKTNYTIDKCVFYDNNADSHGGAVYNYNSSQIVISDSIFYNNSCDGIPTWGGITYGGAAIWNNNASATVRNCLFYNNNANGQFGYGGAVVSSGGAGGMTIENCTFTGNNASSDGGVLTLFGNARSTIINSILWGNGPDQIYLNSGTASASYSDIQGGWPGTANQDADPLFTIGLRGNYYLSHSALQGALSPAVDAGSGDIWTYGLTLHTTRTDNLLDLSVIDLGFHYPLP